MKNLYALLAKEGIQTEEALPVPSVMSLPEINKYIKKTRRLIKRGQKVLVVGIDGNPQPRPGKVLKVGNVFAVITVNGGEYIAQIENIIKYNKDFKWLVYDDAYLDLTQGRTEETDANSKIVEQAMVKFDKLEILAEEKKDKKIKVSQKLIVMILR